MKLEIKNNLIIAHAENTQESLSLMQLAGPKVPITGKKHATHKRPLHKKMCAECGQECKGAVGLGIHKAKSHPVNHVITEMPQFEGTKEALERL